MKISIIKINKTYKNKIFNFNEMKMFSNNNKKNINVL